MSAGCACATWRPRWGRNRAGHGANLFAVALLAAGLLGGILTMILQFVVSPLYYGMQGRYLFAFLPAFAVLAVWGWQFWWPARWKSGGLLAGLGLLALFDMGALVAILVYFYP
jgi:hypothetical protein